jgi:branched-chain amino acid transport system substrate-binding protein
MILVLALFFAALFTFPAAAAPVRIGVPVVMSGIGAFAGAAEKNTMEMMAAEANRTGGINGRSIEIIAYDTEDKPDIAVAAAKRLIVKDQVDAMIGLDMVINTMAVIPVAEQYKVPLIALSPSLMIVKPVRKWVFKAPADDSIIIRSMLSYMQSKGVKQLAVVTAMDPYGDGARKEFQEQAPGHGIKIVFDERFAIEDSDITPVFNKIKSTGAQAVACWTSRQSIVTTTLNYRQTGLTLPLFHSTGSYNQDTITAIGKGAEGMKTVAVRFFDIENIPDSDPHKKVAISYQNIYKQKYGKDANQYGANAYDAFNILAAAMKKTGTDKEKLRDAVEQTKGYVGVNGTFTYSPTDHAGLSGDAAIAYEVIGGQWRVAK